MRLCNSRHVPFFPLPYSPLQTITYILTSSKRHQQRRLSERYYYTHPSEQNGQITGGKYKSVQEGQVYELEKNVEGTIRKTSFRGLGIDGGLHPCYEAFRRMCGSRNQVHIHSGRRNLKLLTAKHCSKTWQQSFVERKYDRNGRWHFYWGVGLLTCSYTRKDDAAL